MNAFLFLAAAVLQTTVRDAQELRQAVSQARAGARILVAPGEYPGGYHFSNLRGEPGKPIVIAAADPSKPPVLKGGGTSLQLSRVEHIELRHLVLEGARDNGLNIDDGGDRERPSRHVTLVGLRVADVGAKGNQDGIKLSGVADFRVEGCVIERWGGGGSAVDMVGCHRGVIEGNTFRHIDGGGSGVQMKGGCADIAVRRNRFENAGSRAVNIGGSTSLEFFRPPLKDPPFAEARNIRVEGNTFLGSDAPIAFVGVEGAVVRCNTIYVPRRWAIRILQETTAEGFVPCRRGEFSDNIVVFRSTQWSEGGVNVGPGTEPRTFVFTRNFWFCVDDPSRSRPTLPTEERGGMYGVDPLFRDAEKGDLRLRPGSPAKGLGAEGI